MIYWEMWIHRDSQQEARLQLYESLLSFTQKSRAQEKKGGNGGEGTTEQNIWLLTGIVPWQ